MPRLPRSVVTPERAPASAPDPAAAARLHWQCTRSSGHSNVGHSGPRDRRTVDRGRRPDPTMLSRALAVHLNGADTGPPPPPWRFSTPFIRRWSWLRPGTCAPRRMRQNSKMAWPVNAGDPLPLPLPPRVFRSLLTRPTSGGPPGAESLCLHPHMPMFAARALACAHARKY